MVTIRQADIWWADLAEPTGSSPGYRRPVLVIQGDAMNRSRLSTVICVPLTSQLEWADAPGNVLLSKKITGLSKDSVVNVSQIMTVDKSFLIKHIGQLPEKTFLVVLAGIDIILGR